MNDNKQEKLNMLMDRIDKLHSEVDSFHLKIKENYDNVFECNKEAFRIYCGIEKGDYVMYSGKSGRKKKNYIGYFNGFKRSNITTAYYFELNNEKKETVCKELIQMTQKEMDSFSKLVKLKNPFT